jgi:hypothetical protein
VHLLLDDLVDGGKTIREVVGIQQLLVGRLEKAITAVTSQMGWSVASNAQTSRAGAAANLEFVQQLSKMHLPGAGLGEDEERHDDGLSSVPQPRLLLSMEAWESG